MASGYRGRDIGESLSLPSMTISESSTHSLSQESLRDQAIAAGSKHPRRPGIAPTNAEGGVFVDGLNKQTPSNFFHRLPDFHMSTSTRPTYTMSQSGHESLTFWFF